MNNRWFRVVLAVVVPAILFLFAYELSVDEGRKFSFGENWSLWLLFVFVVAYIELRLLATDRK